MELPTSSCFSSIFPQVVSKSIGVKQDLKDAFEVLRVAFLTGNFFHFDLKDTFEVLLVTFLTGNFFDLKNAFEVLRVAF